MSVIFISLQRLQIISFSIWGFLLVTVRVFWWIVLRLSAKQTIHEVARGI